MSRQKQKGTLAETAVVRYLRRVLGDSENTIRRETLHGTRDVGDVTGVRIHGEPVVIEVKNHKAYELKQWLGEARLEAGNADAPYYVVAFKPVRVTNPGDYMVLTDLRTLARIAGHGIIEEES